MIQFDAVIQKFEKQGEKTGWAYIEIPEAMAQQLKAGNKKSFRVKGKLDNYSIEQVALLPMGDGAFIMPINAVMRKQTGKRKGAVLKVMLEEDTRPLSLSSDLMTCLEDEPKALTFFNKLPLSHRNYFSKWIESAKTEPTKAKRIAQTVNAMAKSQDFPTMIRALKLEKEK
jgi:hypothetical protein